MSPEPDRTLTHVIVVGAGFAGLSAACFLGRGGVRVTLVERHEQPGGRARVWAEGGFRFDMGPSWYWMPDLFERFFGSFGRQVPEFYDLQRLDPSYRIVWPEGSDDDARHWDVPAGVPALRSLFETVEPGAGAALDRFLVQTRYIYESANADYLLRPSLSVREFVDPRLLAELVRMRMLRSMSAYARSFVTDERLARLLEWPVLFLGASARKTSAMYSLMSYADMALGTWYPAGGMHRIIEGMMEVARGLGVEFRFGARVERIQVESGGPGGARATGVVLEGGEALSGDAVLAAADYHHVEQELLPPEHRQYSPRYWETRTLSPSSLLYYLGVRGELPSLPHHTLFFDRDLDAHMEAVYDRPAWPDDPLFYVCHPSASDPTVAPEGHANLFLLVSLAPGLQDSDAALERTFHQVMDRLEVHVDRPLRGDLVVQRSYAMRDFVADYGALGGNAYGLANTLRQTGPFKPRLRSAKVRGLYFAGQLTVPGPGMPPSLVSGELAAGVLLGERE
ncbi:phytoene desaturase family protein [soil metagenome]